jgi:hypothetical protein
MEKATNNLPWKDRLYHMHKTSPSNLSNWHQSIVITAILAAMSIASFTIIKDAGAAPAQNSSKTTTVWMQAADSCAQALSGATFTVSGPGINKTTQPTAGKKPEVLPSYNATPKAQRHCPENRGTCTTIHTGCTSTILNVPATGTAQYTIIVNQLPPGQWKNVSYAPCEGGPACHSNASGLPIKEIAYVTVASNGKVQAWVQNTEPDGYQDRWPGTGFFAANQADPIMSHFFGVAATAHGQFTCDNDGDADDYMTGTSKWAHCDNDVDKH